MTSPRAPTAGQASSSSSGVPSDPRIQQALTWLHGRADELASAGWQLRPESLRPASSDASFRRYFRVDGLYRSSPSHLILMDAPPQKEDIRPFIAVDRLMERAGLHVPRIWLDDPAQGFLLCADLGDITYAKEIARLKNDADHCSGLYRDAWHALIQLQAFSMQQRQASQNRIHLPAYDASRLMQEMRLFDEWYLGRHKPIEHSPGEQEKLLQIYQLILERCIAQPAVIVHRDYHSRNLMVTSDHSPGVLDFQDAVVGPITYDLVSLLRDAYIEWPEEVQIDWAARYWQDAKKSGLPVAGDFAEFWRDFEWMGLQRHLKVLGIFARLNYRDGKDNYLNDLPLVWRYAMSVARRYQGLGPLARLLERCA